MSKQNTEYSGTLHLPKKAQEDRKFDENEQAVLEQESEREKDGDPAAWGQRPDRLAMRFPRRLKANTMDEGNRRPRPLATVVRPAIL